MSNNRSTHQAGTTLLEVLVALLVLSFGLLGLAAMQGNALKNNQSSFERTQAVMLSYFIIDSVRVDRANSSSYTMGETCTTIATPVDPAPPLDSVGQTKQKWMEVIQANLGKSACGQITCDATNCAIKIRWNDERGTGGSNTQAIETKTRL
jgi:type IV pilus assembly protein PilV